jgi:hypothetical protein
MSAIVDREVLELLQERPDLLAVADAVSVTQPHRRPMKRIAVAPIVVAAAAIVLLLLAPWQSHGPSIVDRALAAVGSGPVVHAVIEYSWPQDVLVNLTTGAERDRVHRQELWYDEQRGELRDRVSTDGGVPVDYISHDESGEGLDPSLTGFATEYRAALVDGRARVIADVDVDGRLAKRIEFAPRSGGAVEQVDVDAETFVPLRFHETYPPNGRRSPDFHVVTIESVPYDASLFTASMSVPQLSGGEVSEAHTVALADAARVLGGKLLSLGRAPGTVEVSRTTARLSDGSELKGALVRLGYGSIHVSLANNAAGPAGSYAVGFGEGALPRAFPEGSVAVTGNDADGWQGELRRGGFDVMVAAPTKAQVVATARALTPER